MRVLLVVAALAAVGCGAARVLPSESIHSWRADRSGGGYVRVAYHEAGHAIVALKTGHSVHGTGASDGEGYVTVRGDDPRALIRVLMAGHLSEQRFAGVPLSAAEAGAIDDYKRIREVAAERDLSDSDLDAAYREVESLLADPTVWVSVSSLAHRLERLHMTGQTRSRP
jgi:hypothetical protein